VALAIFDLDNTLLNGDSDHGWGQFLVDQGIVDGQTFKEANDRFFEQYQNGTLNIYEYCEFTLNTLSEYSMEQLAQWHQQFMADMVLPMILAKGRALINEHRQKGDFILIITATNAFVTGPIAKSLSADDLIATEPEIVNGRYTGKVIGTPSFQEGKIKRLQQWLANHNQHSIHGSYFYSDSFNDIPLLEIVDHPIAVDPDLKLEGEANSRGWPIISLRD